MLVSAIFAITALGLTGLGAASPEEQKAEAVEGGRRCGFKIAPCPDTDFCRPVNPRCSDLYRCPGVCTRKPKRPYPPQPPRYPPQWPPRPYPSLPPIPITTLPPIPFPTEPPVSDQTYKSCGGFTITPQTCDAGYTCKDDPRKPDSCGMACDVPGICIPDKAPQCGGFAGFQCPAGLTCYDAPNDGCDPRSGGADCIGICL